MPSHKPDGTFAPGHPYRFLPGHPGMGGRPKTPKLWEELQRLMESPDEGVHDSTLEKGKKKSHAGWLAEAIALNMAGGNAALVKDYLDRTLGKPKETHEHTGADGGPIAVETKHEFDWDGFRRLHENVGAGVDDDGPEQPMDITHSDA